MTPSIVFAIFFLLPVVTHQITLDEVRARVQQIHDLESLITELSREGPRAVITVGILPIVYGYSADIERFLLTHKHFAKEFGPFARTAVGLALLYLDSEIIAGTSFYLEPHDHERMVKGVTKFADWLEDMRERGIITYDADVESLDYVGPGDDLSTEELRGILRLLLNQSAAVPEDPAAGGELYVLGFLPARGLGMLVVLASIGVTPPEALPEVVEFYTGLMRTSAAIFRLSFRHPDRMDYADSDRELVVDHIQKTFEVMREATEKGKISAHYWKPIGASLDRILKWKRAKEREEL